MKPRILIVITVCFACMGCHKPNYQYDVNGFSLQKESPKTFYDFSNLDILTLIGNRINIFKYEGESQTPLLAVDHRINSLSCSPINGDIIYAETKYLSLYSSFKEYKLVLIKQSDQSSSILFRSPDLIHSICWSSDGKHIAFLVGVKRRFTDWGPQWLYVIRNVHGNREFHDLGLIDIIQYHTLDPDQMAPLLVWGPESKSIYWVSEDEYAMRCSIDSFERERLFNANGIYKVTDEKYLITRGKPWKLIWISKDILEEKEIAQFNLPHVGIGIEIPDSSIMSFVVFWRYKKGFDFKTVYVNIETGEVLGKLDDRVFGYRYRK